MKITHALIVKSSANKIKYINPKKSMNSRIKDNDKPYKILENATVIRFAIIK